MNINAETLIQDAFDRATDTFKIIEKGRRLTIHGCYSINISSILTKLIQDTGRFCDTHADDILFDLEDIVKIAKHGVENMIPHVTVKAVGIRASGVDGAEYIFNNMNNNWHDDYYRRIYVIKITHLVEHDEDTVTVELRDIKAEVDIAAYRMQIAGTEYETCQMKHNGTKPEEHAEKTNLFTHLED